MMTDNDGQPIDLMNEEPKGLWDEQVYLVSVHTHRYHNTVQPLAVFMSHLEAVKFVNKQRRRYVKDILQGIHQWRPERPNDHLMTARPLAQEVYFSIDKLPWCPVVQTLVTAVCNPEEQTKGFELEWPK